MIEGIHHFEKVRTGENEFSILCFLSARIQIFFFVDSKNHGIGSGQLIGLDAATIFQGFGRTRADFFPDGLRPLRS